MRKPEFETCKLKVCLALFSRFLEERAILNVFVLSFSRDKYERNIESIAKSKAKQNEEKTT